MIAVLLILSVPLLVVGVVRLVVAPDGGDVVSGLLVLAAGAGLLLLARLLGWTP